MKEIKHNDILNIKTGDIITIGGKNITDRIRAKIKYITTHGLVISEIINSETDTVNTIIFTRRSVLALNTKEDVTNKVLFSNIAINNQGLFRPSNVAVFEIFHIEKVDAG